MPCAHCRGVFLRVHNLTEQLISLRIYVEAAIDFPEEEIDFLADGHVLAMLDKVRDELSTVLKEAGQGALLRDGMTVVIAGRPNAGKSSLLNALAGREAAIVTEIAGTTRDILREHIHIDGMPLHVVDTAGLRDTDDQVEKSVWNGRSRLSVKRIGCCWWWMPPRRRPSILCPVARIP